MGFDEKAYADALGTLVSESEFWSGVLYKAQPQSLEAMVGAINAARAGRIEQLAGTVKEETPAAPVPAVASAPKTIDQKVWALIGAAGFDGAVRAQNPRDAEEALELFVVAAGWSGAIEAAQPKSFSDALACVAKACGFEAAIA